MAEQTKAPHRKRRRRRQQNTQAPQGSSSTAGVAERSTRADGPRTYPLNMASPFKRLYAWLIDIGLLLGIIFTVAPISGGRVFSSDSAPQDIFIILAYFILPTGIWGRTVGKWVAGIIVVDEEGRVPGVGVVIPREMVGKLVSYLAAGVGLAWMVFDAKRQGWHDKIAGTYVVNSPNSGGSFLFKRLMGTNKKNGS
ncbi:MAG: RDD family protein [Dehalococcoidia bacterium]